MYVIIACYKCTTPVGYCFRCPLWIFWEGCYQDTSSYPNIPRLKPWQSKVLTSVAHHFPISIITDSLWLANTCLERGLLGFTTHPVLWINMLMPNTWMCIIASLWVTHSIWVRYYWCWENKHREYPNVPVSTTIQSPYTFLQCHAHLFLFTHVVTACHPFHSSALPKMM